MSLQPGTPNKPTTSSGILTPGGIATEFSKLDLPAPSNLRLHLPSNPHPNSTPQAIPQPPTETFKAGSTDKPSGSNETGDISGPEPEAITEMRRKTRSESMSEQISETLARMKLPQPERIFGPDEVEGGEGEETEVKGKGGVNAADWESVMLDDDVPEAVKEPVRMSHSRNTSRM
jgi:tryptophanyl-tRNA synthetase